MLTTGNYFQGSRAKNCGKRKVYAGREERYDALRMAVVLGFCSRDVQNGRCKLHTKMPT